MHMAVYSFPGSLRSAWLSTKNRTPPKQALRGVTTNAAEQVLTEDERLLIGKLADVVILYKTRFDYVILGFFKVEEPGPMFRS